MIKPPIVVTDSRYIPVAIRRYVSWRDGVCVSPGCGATSDLQFDHSPAWNLLQPKRHDPDMIFLMCKACHSVKTTGTNPNRASGDTTDAARAKRLDAKHRGEYRPTKNPLRSRGFQKGQARKILSRGFPTKTKAPR